MTNFEINKRVAEKLGLIDYLFIADDIGELIWNVPSNVNYGGLISSRGNPLDFCNNITYAWVVITENKICLNYDAFKDEWIASPAYDESFRKRVRNINPLIAAMLVFINI